MISKARERENCGHTLNDTPMPMAAPSAIAPARDTAPAMLAEDSSASAAATTML
ncbi:hypothetical protein IAG25_38670 [Caballeronia sp. EK]|uniref:hypothetical protein n=1 Tax=Caballeronia sp. EK TaxID=2767469 RepID=UPI0016553795|nr:hypothetical protein [Caballeronia sp. EK]MBC8642728.1 hypothetical protein [Caballeronia sp. EK]